jgi:type IV secretory pathway VirB4 component
MNRGETFVHLGDSLPLWHFEDDYLIFNDGSLGKGFHLSGVDISIATNEAKNAFCANVSNLINSINEGIKVQVFYRLSSDVSELIDKHEMESGELPQEVKPIVDSRIKFLKKKSSEKQYYWPEVYLFVKSAPINFKKQGLFGKKQLFEQILEADFQDHKELFSRSVSTIQDYLETLQLGPKDLGKDEWFKLIFEYFNLNRSEVIGSPRYREMKDDLSPNLVEQLVLSDCFVHQDSIQIDRTFFKFINLGTLPERTVASMISSLTAMPFHYWITQTVEVHNQQNEKDKLQLKRRMAYSMAAGAKNVSDLESESKLANLEGLLQELIQGSEKVMSMGLVLIIWDRDKKELEWKSDQILLELRSMNQAEGVVESMAAFDTFIRGWPGSCESYRQKKVKTSNVTHLMPLFSYWTGNQRPVCFLQNRDRVPFTIDYFDPELPSWSGVIFGGTGAGKSFTICQLMLQFSTQMPRPKIVFIDNGRSSENLVNVCGGEFIDVSVDSGICLNPFDLGKDETKPSAMKIKSILAVLEIMLKDECMISIPKKEKALLEECITELYKNCKGTPKLSDLRKVLVNHKEATLKSYGQILYSWTGETAFGKLLDGTTNISLNRPMTSFEVKGLDDFPELKEVFMLLITNYVQRQAESDLSCPYTVVCDEAHRLMKSQLTREYITFCYRTFRKYNCSILLLTQNYRDVLGIPEIAEAILPNSNYVIILRQRKIDWSDFQKSFDFNEAELAAVKSLEIKKREFSEIFFMQDEKRAILRIVPDPLSYWICTSDAGDKFKIQQMKEENPNFSTLDTLLRLAYPDEEHVEVD